MSSTTSSSGADRPIPLRLVITNTSRSWGGNEHFALQVAEGLADRGHDPLFLWSHPVVGDRVARAGLPHRRLRLRADADLVGMWRLAAVFRRHRADAVILTKWREYLLGGLAARLARVPLTVLRLGLRVTPRGDLKRRLIFRLADRIIVNAGEIRDALLSRSFIEPDKVRVVHNGVDLSRFQPGQSGQSFRRKFGIAERAPLLVTLGSLTPQKDHDLLVRAFAEVVGEVPEAQLAIAGEGFLRRRLEERIRELGLIGRAHLVGFCTDVRPLLAAGDLFVLSSANEGMARALLEAMACGLPVVATSVSGTGACVFDGENGLVVPPGDSRRLSRAVARLLIDEPLRLRMGQRSRRIVEQRFSDKSMLENILRELGSPRR